MYETYSHTTLPLSLRISDTPVEDSVSNTDIPVSVSNSDIARKLENTTIKPELVTEHRLKTMVIMDIVEQHEIKAELTEICNEVEAETDSCETQVEFTNQINIEAELSNMKNEINYVEIATDTVVANMGIDGNDEQPDIDIGLGRVPEYTKYYEPGI